MTSSPSDPSVEPAARSEERRRAPRFTLMSMASVQGESGEAGHCTVQNLSGGGALIVGAVPLLVGEAVRVVLPLRGDQAATMVGRVVRRRAPIGAAVSPRGGLHAAGEARTWSYGVVFAGVSRDGWPDGAERPRRAGDGGVAALRPQRRPVLVLDGTADACAPTVAVLAAAGVPAVAVTTVLDALGWLLAEGPFAACIVNPRPRHAEGPELLRYLAEVHPRMRRIAIEATGAALGQLSAQLVLHGPLAEKDVQHVVRVA